MSKLFIFGIGGTGSRVLKSLTMLLAAGVKVNADKVIPIIIDPDDQNGNLEDCINLLKNYQQLKRSFSSPNHNYFSTDLVDLESLNIQNDKIKQEDENKNFHNKNLKVKAKNKFSLQVSHNNKSFEQYIGYHSLPANTKYLIGLLFTEKNLKAKLDIGFLGNPNVGSVVLNEIIKSEDFRIFANNFNNNDRIFIISSIFGGTGAAGFPLLIKNFRQGNIPGAQEAIKNAVIGAVTVMPYFKITNKENNNEIDSSNFIPKTKAALSYYEGRVDEDVDAFYYIGDASSTNNYEHQKGGNNQKNKAHFVELASALSIVDFSYKHTRRDSPQAYDYSVENIFGGDTLTFSSFKVNEIFKNAMFNFQLFGLINNKANQNSKAVFYRKNGFEGILNSHELALFSSFFNHFEEWLNELRDNKVSFNCLNNDIKNLVNGRKAEESLFNKFNDDHIIKKLNTISVSSNTKGYAEAHQKLAEIIKEKHFQKAL